MFGQLNHFKIYAKEQIPYAIERYSTETKRLLGVLNTQLAATVCVSLCVCVHLNLHPHTFGMCSMMRCGCAEAGLVTLVY